MERKKIEVLGTGKEIISLLHNPDVKKITPKLIKNVWSIADDGVKSFWPVFVIFPPELSKVFPGSSLLPQDFLQGLNYSKEDAVKFQEKILSDHLGTINDPTLKIEQRNGDNKFSLTVLNGSINQHALEMTNRASLGFSDPTNRAIYQDSMYASISPFYEDEGDPKYGVRIHDDCLASGDSIVGYLFKLVSKNDPSLRQGVEVMVTTATTQSILFLKSFAKAFGIDLSIKVGQLAYGLSEGTVKDNGVREHANYITYPEELLELLPEKIATQLRSYQSEVSGKKLIQVVGDMGVALEGIKEEELIKIITDLPYNILCWWNRKREDPHGKHPNRKEKLSVPEPVGNRPISVYLARGGYMPYVWDKEKYKHFNTIDVVVKQASRQCIKGIGFGVGFRSA